ncbi:MAG: Maf family protein [Thermotogota bacterium]
MIINKKIILGSSSPRRKELLKMIVKDFEIRAKRIDESFTEQKPEEIVKEIALNKMNVLDIYINEIIITADTIVCLENEILFKPNSKEKAIKYLNSLKNNWHQVYTGICIKSESKEELFSVKTDVHFRDFDMETLLYYIENYNVYDKAGGYGIQDFGAVFIDEIKGDYYNIMGLPISELYSRLKKI